MRDPFTAPAVVGCLPMAAAPALGDSGDRVVHPGTEATMSNPARNRFYAPPGKPHRCRWCGILCSSIGSQRDHEFFCPKKPEANTDE